MLEKLQQARKAIVPVVVTGVLFLLAEIGIREDVTVAEAVTALVTLALVWLVPNRR